MTQPPRAAPIRSVLVVGAGAMGCLFAARMAETGAAVTLIDIDRIRLECIASDGIALADDAGSRVIRLDARLAEDVTGPIDAILMFTKGMHSGAAIRSIAHLARDTPIAVTLQNGIGNGELLAETFGADRVVHGGAHIPADFVAPRAVSSHGRGELQLGGFTSAAHPLAERFAALLDRAGFTAIVRHDVTAAIWSKAAFNAALNPIGMICEVPNAGIDNPAGRRIAYSVVTEAVAVAAALGIAIDAAGIRGSIDDALVAHAGHKASMLQDRLAGRRTEIDTINGAIVREGARLGVPTPVCATLADLISVTETRAGR